MRGVCLPRKKWEEGGRRRRRVRKKDIIKIGWKSGKSVHLARTLTHSHPGANWMYGLKVNPETENTYDLLHPILNTAQTLSTHYHPLHHLYPFLSLSLSPRKVSLPFPVGYLEQFMSFFLSPQSVDRCPFRQGMKEEDSQSVRGMRVRLG